MQIYPSKPTRKKIRFLPTTELAYKTNLFLNWLNE